MRLLILEHIYYSDTSVRSLDSEAAAEPTGYCGNVACECGGDREC